MDKLHHRTVDKLDDAVTHLDNILRSDDLTEGEIQVAISIAKRVRRESTILVRHLAALRDQLQP